MLFDGNGQLAVAALGTSGNPFVVSTEAQLRQVGTGTPAGWTLAAHYRLGNNITLPATPVWTPIGTTTNPFTGSFDGDGFTIFGLRITAAAGSQGMFRALNGTIRNLTLDQANITNAGISSSALVGEIMAGATATINNVTIQNSAISGGVASGDNTLGAILGNIGGNVTITNCRVINTTVNGAGGRTGGLFGGASAGGSGLIANNFVNTTVSSTGPNVGGIGGINNSTTGLTIEFNVFAGNITASSNNSGGIIGGGVGSSTTRNNIVISERITSTGTARRIDPVGTVALANNRAFSGTLVNNAAATGTLTDLNGLSITAAEVRTQSTWATAGFDFATVWEWQDGFMPRLRGDNSAWIPWAQHLDGIVRNQAQLITALAETPTGGTIQIGANFDINASITMPNKTLTIQSVAGQTYTIRRAGSGGITPFVMFDVSAGNLTLENITIDGGAVW